MARASVYREQRPNGTVRFRVAYRLGGRESKRRHGGSFGTLREARQRRDFIAGELASLRVPDLGLLDSPRVLTTLRTVAEAWRVSRVDVASGTAQTHIVNLNRILRDLGDRSIEEIDADDVMGLVSRLRDAGLKRESIRKTMATLAMVLITPSECPTRQETNAYGSRTRIGWR
jgi:hypothetical protein